MVQVVYSARFGSGNGTGVSEHDFAGQFTSDCEFARHYATPPTQLLGDPRRINECSRKMHFRKNRRKINQLATKTLNFTHILRKAGSQCSPSHETIDCAAAAAGNLDARAWRRVSSIALALQPPSEFAAI
jgi:hypothetical protein